MPCLSIYILFTHLLLKLCGFLFSCVYTVYVPVCILYTYRPLGLPIHNKPWSSPAIQLISVPFKKPKRMNPAPSDCSLLSPVDVPTQIFPHLSSVSALIL